MAKRKLIHKEKRGADKLKSPLVNQIAWIRKTLKPIASRANRWGATILALTFIAGILGYYFWPKNDFQKLQQQLAENPSDLKAVLNLAEKFLANNQLEEAEKTLLLVKIISDRPVANDHSPDRVLGEQSNPKEKELWQEKHLADPDDIRRLITAWEKILAEKSNYRDGYLQLAFLYGKLGEKEEAMKNLQKAREIDPNFKPAEELEKILKD